MLERLETVVIGTSLNEVSDEVVRAGIEVAHAAGARVYLVHAFQPQLSFGGDPFVSERLVEEAIDAERRLVQKRLREQMTRLEIGPEELAGVRLELGPPHRVLIDAAEAVHADLIVVGAAESPRIAKLFGSTADRVLRKSTRPVLMIRGGLPLPPERVLMPVDLSPLSAVAFRRGMALLHLIAPERPPRVEAMFVLEGNPAGGASKAQEELERFVRRNLRGGWTADARVLEGDAEEEIRIRAAAWEADLIVLGTHGRGGFERLLLGSVASDVIRRGAASVLVIPPDTTAREKTPDLAAEMAPTLPALALA